jgi:hypothetical protein
VGGIATSAGSDPLIEGYDGSAWRVVASPAPSDQSTLDAVTCAAANECWAVGYARLATGSATLIEQYQGSGWSLVSNPTLGVGPVLSAVTCAAADDCWAVGGIGDAALIEHYSAGAWSVSPAGADAPPLTAVACGSASDCWALGFDATKGSPFLDHFDGTNWTAVSGPSLDGVDGGVRALLCTGPSTCWAVGGVGDAPGSDQPLIEQLTATGWTVVAGPTTPGGDSLGSISCASPDDCWAVGGDGLIEHYSDGGWTVASGPSLNGGVLFGVSCPDAGDCWAVGNTNSQAAGEVVIETNSALGS